MVPLHNTRQFSTAPQGVDLFARYSAVRGMQNNFFHSFHPLSASHLPNRGYLRSITKFGIRRGLTTFYKTKQAEHQTHGNTCGQAEERYTALIDDCFHRGIHFTGKHDD